MEPSFVVIEAWLAGNAPRLQGMLNPPASIADIATFEARTSLVLPPEARQFYAIHDGEAEGSDGIFGCRRWLPLEVVAEEVELIGSEGIVPLFRSGGGDLLCVKSQANATPDRHLYEWWHEVPEPLTVVAESLEAFILQFVTDLYSGRYLYLPDELEALIDRQDLPEEQRHG